MNCSDVRRLLPPYADGELDVSRHVEMEQHLADCAPCAEQHDRLDSLRAAIRTSAPAYRASTALRARIEAGMSRANPWPLSAGRRVAMAAGILLFVGASTGLASLWLRSRPGSEPLLTEHRIAEQRFAEQRFVEQVVAGHVRSLQFDHLTDVASSDRHAVKPWFLGQVDFSPPVPDLSEQGFLLAGGRLDYLAGRPVAALVYRRRLHAINVFVWPAEGEESVTARHLARHGFHLRHWQREGLCYWAISDLNDAELDEFVRLLQSE